MARDEAKTSKEFADLIAGSCERIGAEPVFGLVKWMANLSPEQIMIESRKNSVSLSIDQAKSCSRQTRTIVNVFLVHD